MTFCTQQNKVKSFVHILFCPSPTPSQLYNYSEDGILWLLRLVNNAESSSIVKTHYMPHSVRNVWLELGEKGLSRLVSLLFLPAND